MGDLIPPGDVEAHAAGLAGAVAAHEFVEPVLSTSYCRDFGAGLDQVVGHCSSDAGCGSDHEDVLVRKGHVVSYLVENLECERFAFFGCRLSITRGSIF